MVLVHELCHIIEANHGPRFKALMDLHCPDWRVSKRWLDAHSPRA
jgi:predicted metal-dependent hydrolase